MDVEKIDVNVDGREEDGGGEEPDSVNHRFGKDGKKRRGPEMDLYDEDIPF